MVPFGLSPNHFPHETASFTCGGALHAEQQTVKLGLDGVSPQNLTSMAPLALLTVILTLSLLFVAADESPLTVAKCVDKALARGDSPEGWSVVKDKFCEQKIRRLVCANGDNFFNVVRSVHVLISYCFNLLDIVQLSGGDNDCCDPPRVITWQHELARSGWVSLL